jgi:hypothetical protein
MVGQHFASILKVANKNFINVHLHRSSFGGAVAATDTDLSSNCSMTTVSRENVLKFHKCMQLLYGQNIYQECFQVFINTVGCK